MRCSACEFDNPEGMKFCGQCGNALPAGCPSCGFENPPGFAFCGNCGTNLKADAAPEPPAPQPAAVNAPAAERRHITVLFCDLVDSTSLSGRLDPEELREIVIHYQRIAGDVVSKYDGHIAQYLGDGLLVYFGFPTAHENDAVRAVHTGLEIVQAIQAANGEVQARWNTSLSVRVGIHTGAVVTGAVGNDAHQEQLALGQTPNIAARLQGEAVPDQVVMSGQTATLLQQQFKTESLGTRALKGVEEDVEVIAALGIRSPDEGGASARRQNRSPVIGREAELAQLHQLHERVRAGAGRTVVIAGEPGIGKSRLIEQFRADVGYSAPQWLNVRCSELHTNTPFKPVADLMTRAYRINLDDPPEAQLEALRKGIEQSENIREPHADAVLAALLGLAAEAPLPAEWSPHQIRQATTELLTDLLLGTPGRAEPKVCLVEDLQWADPSTLELVEHLMVSVMRRNALLLVTRRAEATFAWPAPVKELELEPLGEQHARALVEMIDEQGLLSSWARDEILHRTDGVPIFVEELTRLLLSKAKASGEGAGRLIPETLRDSLAARLDQLGAAKEVVQFAAVLGRNFNYEQLEELWPGTETALAQQLVVLLREDLFIQSGAARAAQFRFRHALIRDAAYDSLLHSRRRALHEQVADSLIEAGEREPAVIADHLEKARQTEKAASYYQIAAHAASKRSAVAEAANLFRNARDLVRNLPASEALLIQELKIESGLGNALAEQLGWAEAGVGESFQRVVEIASEVDDQKSALRANINLRAYYTTSGRHNEAFATAEALLEQVPADSPLRPTIHTELALPLHHLGRLEESSRETSQAISVSEAPDFPERTATMAQFWALAHGTENEWMLGRLGNAEAMLARMLQTARGIGNPFLISWALGYGNRSKILLGTHLDDARAEVEQSYQIADEHGFESLRCWAEFGLGWIDLELRDPHSAITKIEAGIEKMYATGARYSIPMFEATRARALLGIGEVDKAIEAIEFAIRSIDDTQEKCHYAELVRVRGESHMLQRNIGAAIADFETGIAVAKAQSAASWQLRAASSLAEAANYQTEARERARNELTEALAAFDEGEAQPDIVQAREKLAHMG